MQLKTKYFGELTVEENTIVTMKHPIYGFEELKQFVILNDTEIGTDIVWFQSVEEIHICFMLANLSQVAPTYQPNLSAEILAMVEMENLGDISLFAILVIEEEFKDSTANLKSPIVLNRLNNYGMQVILEEEFSLKQRIFDVGTY